MREFILTQHATNDQNVEIVLLDSQITVKNVLAKFFFLFKKQDRKTMGKLWLMLKFC